MGIEKAIEAAMRAISFNMLDVKKTYQMQRWLGGGLGKLSFIRSVCAITETEVASETYMVPVRIFHPDKVTDVNDVIVFFHGGGWVTGDINSYHQVCAALALYTGCKVASVDYRLAPEHKFPLGFNDCYAVAKYFFLNAGELFGISPDRVILMGDSAGGNLAAAVSLKARDTRDFNPKRQVLIYPSVNNTHGEDAPYESVRTNGKDYILTTQRIQEYMELYMQTEEDLLNPYFAPLCAADFSNQPATLIITAEFDPLRDEGEDYGEKLRAGGSTVVVYRMEQAIHGFFSLSAGMPQVKKSYEMIREFLEAQGNGKTESEQNMGPAG